MKELLPLVFISIFIAFYLLKDLLFTKRWPFIHESALAIMTGLFFRVICLGLGFDIGLETNNRNFFFEIILPLILIGLAAEVDITLTKKHISYILLYGVVGSFINFVGLFHFILVFSHFSNLKILDHANRLFISSSSCGNFNSN